MEDCFSGRIDAVKIVCHERMLKTTLSFHLGLDTENLGRFHDNQFQCYSLIYLFNYIIYSYTVIIVLVKTDLPESYK